MISFNVLGIYNDHLIIDVSVLSGHYYENVYLDSIVIDTQDTYSANGPSSHPVYEFTIPDVEVQLSHQIYSQKQYRLELSSAELDSLDQMFFVYVRTKGAPSPDIPCGMDNDTTLIAVLNMQPFYAQAMQFTRRLVNNCSQHQNFSDYILKFKALELAIKTGNYSQAIQYYKEFFKGVAPDQSGGCSCENH